MEKPFDLDLHEVDSEEWRQVFAEFKQQILPCESDCRLLAQLAWLDCAGAQILSAIQDGLNGISALRRQNQGPSKPIAYLRTCLDESVGRERLEALLKLAPKRGECERFIEGATS